MSTNKLNNIPLLPLRGLLVYPTMILHIDVGRERSVFAIEHAIAQDNLIFLATQKDISIENPEPEDLYKIGTLAFVKSLTQLPNGTYRILIEGIERAEWSNYEEADLYPVVEVIGYPDDEEIDAESEALMRTLLTYFKKYSKVSKKVTEETYDSVASIVEPGRLADMVASHLPLKLVAKQEVLEITDVNERLEWLMSRLYNEQEVLNLEKKINERVKEAMERTQKEFYLREQMKAIQTELGDKDGKGLEVADLTERIEEVRICRKGLKKPHCVNLTDMKNYHLLQLKVESSAIISSGSLHCHGLMRQKISLTLIAQKKF